jgi:hypothetical protein
MTSSAEKVNKNPARNVISATPEYGTHVYISVFLNPQARADSQIGR